MRERGFGPFPTIHYSISGPFLQDAKLGYHIKGDRSGFMGDNSMADCRTAKGTKRQMKKSEFLQIRISQEIKTALEAKAETLGMTTSDYVRSLIFAAIQKE